MPVLIINTRNYFAKAPNLLFCGSEMFEDNEFIEACSELETPDVDHWEFFTESHDVKIYRLYNNVTGLYSYKIYGELKEVEPQTCADVYMDLDYRNVWDSYVKELREIETDENGAGQHIYWQVKFPFPLSNRDYVYQRQMKEFDLPGSSHVWVVLARAVDPSPVEPCSGVVRVTEYDQSLAITSNGRHGTKAFMRYYDNPGGSIPTWLINWAAKSGVPSFLSQMQSACVGYADYRLRLGNASS